MLAEATSQQRENIHNYNVGKTLNLNSLKTYMYIIMPA